jgi:hypothetical protein
MSRFRRAPRAAVSATILACANLTGGYIPIRGADEGYAAASGAHQTVKNEPSEPCELPGACSVYKSLLSRVEEALGCASKRAKSEIPAEWSESWEKTQKFNSRPRLEYLVRRDMW